MDFDFAVITFMIEVDLQMWKKLIKDAKISVDVLP